MGQLDAICFIKHPNDTNTNEHGQLRVRRHPTIRSEVIINMFCCFVNFM